MGRRPPSYTLLEGFPFVCIATTLSSIGDTAVVNRHRPATFEFVADPAYKRPVPGITPSQSVVDFDDRHVSPRATN